MPVAWKRSDIARVAGTPFPQPTSSTAPPGSIWASSFASQRMRGHS